MNKKDLLCINALRVLSVDCINKAKSGHPGIALGAAPILYSLYKNHLIQYNKDSKWINRDRFILAAGHGSILLYSLLHFLGYKITLEDLKNFRSFNSLTPGHPEYNHTDGIDATSGPLGQGIPMAVGMAMSEHILREKFNKDDLKLIDHYTYVLSSDGDLQEGVAMEAVSLAGHYKLNKLIVLYDSNDIQLDGEVKLANSENTKLKFESMNWNYLYVKDGNDIDDISDKIELAKKSDKPTLIEVKTIIGYGATNQNTSDVHGAPIGLEKAIELKKNLNWNYDLFEIPNEVYTNFKNIIDKNEIEYHKWVNKLELYKNKYQEDYELFNKYLNDGFKIDYNNLPKFENINEATRNTSGKLINYFSDVFPNLIGGSADLTKSTKAKGVNGNYNHDNPFGRNINYGVREHAMGAITNGIVLHGGFKAFSGAFFVFSDYMKPAIRMAALMNIPSIFVFSHDSVLVGEDGPTHQPVEQFTGLRVIPNLNVIRPADCIETEAAWIIALESKENPTLITLTRQNLPQLENTSIDKVKKGGYIISKEKERLDGILLASGSEVDLCLKVQKELLKINKDFRVVSMPSPYLFLKQDIKYQNEVLPNRNITYAFEMGVTNYWYRFASKVYGIDTFGKSGNLEDLKIYYGFTVENIINFILK